MKNLALKTIILLFTLFCITANLVSAKQTFVKAKVCQFSDINEKESFDKNLDLKEELILVDYASSYADHYLNDNSVDVKVIIRKFNLPKGQKELPERPPKK